MKLIKHFAELILRFRFRGTYHKFCFVGFAELIRFPGNYSLTVFGLADLIINSSLSLSRSLFGKHFRFRRTYFAFRGTYCMFPRAVFLTCPGIWAVAPSYEMLLMSACRPLYLIVYCSFSILVLERILHSGLRCRLRN